MNTYQLITLFIIVSILSGITTSQMITNQSDLSTSIGNKLNDKVGAANQGLDTKDDANDQQNEVSIDRSAGNIYTQSLMITNIMINSLNAFSLLKLGSSNGLLIIISIIVTLFRSLMTIYLLILIYDKLKNRKTD